MADLEIVDRYGRRSDVTNVRPDVADMIRSVLSGQAETVSLLGRNGVVEPIPIEDIAEITIRF